MPDNFPDFVNFVVRHPKIDFLDQNNLLLGLKIFDIDIEILNAHLPLAQTPFFYETTELKAQANSAQANL